MKLFKLLRASWEYTGQASDIWSNVTAPEDPKTPRGRGIRDGRLPRFTPGGTQVPMVSPPKSDGENGVPMPPPLPPMPAGLDFYEKVDNQAGPCLREFGKPWVPVSCRPGYQNERSIFPGEKASEKEMFLRHALEEWDRRQFRPDGSWRKDWNPPRGHEPPPPPPVGAFGHPEECHDGRAFNSNELGGRLQRFEECQDGRAFNRAWWTPSTFR